jgi:hypothetical protein
MGPTTRFLCPVDGCKWTHDEPRFEPMDLHVDVEAAFAERTQEVEQLLRDHFETHGVQEWAQTVSNLRQQLAAQQQPIACLACVVAQHNAQRQGLDAGPVNPAAVIANGSGICYDHLQIADGPTLPDRTKGGIVLPGNASRLNGGAN